MQGERAIVVADAGMLSAANLLALEDAGFCFIVGPGGEDPVGAVGRVQDQG